MTLQQARFEANIHARAQRLWQEGYTALDLRADRQEIHIYNEEGTRYIVDVLFGGCDCPCWQEHKLCKHESGWPKLLEEQQAAEDAQIARLEAEYSAREEDEGYFSSNAGGSLW